MQATDESRLNLRPQSVLTGSDEGLDLEVLLGCLEAEFDLAAFLADGRNGRRAKVHARTASPPTASSRQPACRDTRLCARPQARQIPRAASLQAMD